MNNQFVRRGAHSVLVCLLVTANDVIRPLVVADVAEHRFGSNQDLQRDSVKKKTLQRARQRSSSDPFSPARCMSECRTGRRLEPLRLTESTERNEFDGDVLLENI